MYVRIRCTKCRIRFATVRELLDHVATHDTGRAVDATPAVVQDATAERADLDEQFVRASRTVRTESGQPQGKPAA